MSLPPNHVLGVCLNKEEDGGAYGTLFFFKRTLLLGVAILEAAGLDDEDDNEVCADVVPAVSRVDDRLKPEGMDRVVSPVDDRLKPLGGGRVFLQSTSTALSPPPNHALDVCWNKEGVGSVDGSFCQPIVRKVTNTL